MLSGLENPVHLLFILVIALLVFGPRRLPQIGRSLGGGIREFRSSFAELPPATDPDREERRADDHAPSSRQPAG